MTHVYSRKSQMVTLYNTKYISTMAAPHSIQRFNSNLEKETIFNILKKKNYFDNPIIKI